MTDVGRMSVQELLGKVPTRRARRRAAPSGVLAGRAADGG
jgi:hypothetical protein